MKAINHAILLAGGSGTRLRPLTNTVNKHLVPVNGEFIIDYPIKTLKSFGVKNLTIVLGGAHFSQVVSHIKDGEEYGINVNYVYQNKPEGIAHAINLCKRFVEHEKQFAVILGDNIFENHIKFSKNENCAQIVLCNRDELNRFGVASILNNNIVKIEEKPKELDSSLDNYAITGCYLFDNNFFNYFSEIQKSSRGEYEITDIISKYNFSKKLEFTFVNGLWSDAGTHESIAYLNNYFFEKNKKLLTNMCHVSSQIIDCAIQKVNQEIHTIEDTNAFTVIEQNIKELNQTKDNNYSYILYVSYTEFANWLINKGKDYIWTIDGDNDWTIDGDKKNDGISFPCSSKKIAKEFLKIKNNICLFKSSKFYLNYLNIDTFFDFEEKIFEVAWEHDGISNKEHWFLIVDETINDKKIINYIKNNN